MSGELWLIGCGDIFETIAAAWPAIEPDTVLHVVRLESPAAIATPFEERLAAASPQPRVFAALDQSALNFARFDVYARLRLGGRRFCTLIHPSAIVDATAKLGENVWIGAGAVIEARSSIGHNTFVGTRALVLGAAELAAHGWVGAAASVGARAKIGTHCVIGADVRIGAGVEVGRFSSIERPGHYAEPIAERTYIDALFELPVRIYGSARKQAGTAG